MMHLALNGCIGDAGEQLQIKCKKINNLIWKHMLT
jgi:hypothetical protein